MPILEDAAQDVEEVLEDEEIEDIEDAAEKTTTTTKRQRLSSNNEYLHSTSEAAATARDSLKYEDGSKVSGFRIFGFASFPPEDVEKEAADDKVKLLIRKDKKLTNVTDFVVARNADIAAAYLLEGLGWRGGLWETKTKLGAGRSRTTILSTMLDYGKLLATQAFKEVDMPDDGPQALISTPHEGLTVANAQMAKNFTNFFGPDGQYSHYREDDDVGTWKESNKEG